MDLVAIRALERTQMLARIRELEAEVERLRQQLSEADAECTRLQTRVDELNELGA